MSTLQYTFSASITEGPINGQLRFDAVAPYQAVAKVWARNLGGDGIDWFYILQALPIGARLIVQDKNDHTAAVEFRLTDFPIDKGGYFELPAVWVQGTGPLNGGQDVLLVTQPAADVVPVPVPPGPEAVGAWPGAWSQPVFSVLVIAPVEEPITLDEAKLRAGLDWPSPDPARDQLMNDFITSARHKVEQDTGLALLRQTRDLFYDGSVLVNPILLAVGQCRPLQSIISVNPIAPTPTHPIVLPPVPVPWPDFVPGVAVVVRLVAGWDDVAALRREAPLLLQAVGLLTSHYATIGRDLATVGTIIAETPQGYWDLLTPYLPVLVP